MKNYLKQITFGICLTAALICLSGCSSTRSENGVSIEQSRSYNPLSYIPGL